MTAQHTPGPWAYEVDGSIQNDMRHAVLAKSTGLWIAATYRSGTTPEKDASPEADAEAAANAHLIAAAPDLLDALQSIHQWLDDQSDAQSKGGHATFDLMMLREQRDKARAAIARATHKEQA